MLLICLLENDFLMPTPMFESSDLVANLLQSTILLVIVVATRLLGNFALNKQNIQSGELRLRWKVQIRNSCFLLLLLGLLIIWGTELKTIALSLVAVAVALILATKELIMCLTGSLFKMTSGEFTVGDRIKIAEFRGEVVDQTLLSTTLIEVGPGRHMHQQTGRAITLPNSIFVTTPLINESFTHSYVLHSFSVPIELTSNWRIAEQLLLAAAHTICEPYREQAEYYLTRAARNRNVEVPNVKPRVSLNINEPDRIILILRVPAPVRQQGRVEQEIIRTFLGAYLKDSSAPDILPPLEQAV